MKNFGAFTFYDTLAIFGMIDPHFKRAETISHTPRKKEIRLPFFSMKFISLARITLLLTTVLGLAWFSMGADKKTTEKKHIVFLVGDDLKHASGTHEFYAGAMLLKDSLAKSSLANQVTTTVINNWPDDTSVFESADVIVHYYKGNKVHFMNQHHELIDDLAKKGLGQLLSLIHI